MIGIIDYGMGNLRSVQNAFRHLGIEAKVVAAPDELKETTAVVLPGVGAFGDAMINLHRRGFIEALQEEVRRKGKPFLGICLGMQLLGSLGLEYGQHEGLGWIEGVIDRLPEGPPGSEIQVPHIGWNDVQFAGAGGIFAGLGTAKAFYFVHSYKLEPRNRAVISGVCRHGVEFAASVEQDNIWATQFHPEKSHHSGLAVLRNFANRS